MTKVSKAKQQKVLKAIEEAFAAYIDDGLGPVLVPDFDWLGTGEGPAIVWEEGPYEWTLTATAGSILADEEEFQQVTGHKATHYEPVKVDGVFLEPITSWALGMYPE